MLNIKTMALIGACALAVCAGATTAAQAQPWRGDGYGPTQYRAPAYDSGRLTTAYIDRLDWRIDRQVQERLIPWGEARNLRSDLRDVRPLAWRVQSGRANGWEVRRLEATVNRVEAAMNRYASNDRDRYRDYNRDHDWRR